MTKVAALGNTKHVAELGDWVRTDARAAGPLFDQLRTQIIDGVRDGRLSPGTRLPTVRELAGQLGLAVNTVARAYRELEAAGILETRGRFGTFVARVDPADAAMATAAHTYVSAARALGIDKVAALQYVEAAFG
jgi:DNA-binding transcriptional regulator YhcF (GntR family)